MTNTARYTLLINGCDANLDALPPLFTLFQKYWPGLNVPIVLNTETQPYQHEGYEIICSRVCRATAFSASMSWSKRLKETITQTVHTDLVLMYLDDFYLRSPVHVQRLEYCVEYMDKHPETALIQLFSGSGGHWPVAGIPWLVKQSKKAPCLFSLQAGLWRKDRLFRSLRDHESPWEIERWGSKRLRRYPDEFFALKESNGILDYDPTKHGLTGGRWRPETGDLFRREGIDLDVSLRGVMRPYIPTGLRLWHNGPRIFQNWFKKAWNIWRSLRP